MKVWVLTNTPSPYQVALLSAIGRLCPCRLEVRFLSGVHRGARWEPGRGPYFGWRVLGGFGPRTWSDAFRLHPRAVAECAWGSYDIYVLSGQYTSLTFQLCAVLLGMRGKPWAVWLEQPWPDDYKPAWTRSIAARLRWARSLRRKILRCLVRHAHRVLCIGTVAVEAYRGIGAPEDRLAVLPYCCDNERFSGVDPAEVAKIRRIFDLDGRFVFLFSGQLIERKGVDILLGAFSEVAGRFRDVALLIVGDGPLRSTLEHAVSAENRSQVHFAGHVEYEALPPYYHASHVLVLPARHDGWGVVVNEACAAGLAIIATSSVGAARDLVKDGLNGFIVDRDDVAALANRMMWLVEHREDARSFGEKSRLLAESLSLESGARRFWENIAGIQYFSKKAD